MAAQHEVLKDIMGEKLLNLRGKTALVTGATGFIGSHLSQRLLQEGVKVRALVRNPERGQDLEALGAELVPGDMLDEASLRKAVKGCQLVFHLAASTIEFKPLAFYRAVNVEGSHHLAKAALEVGVERFIHMSSVAVYGLQAGQGLTEAAPMQKSGIPYADTKLEGEQLIRSLVKAQGLPAVIVQPHHVYGPEDPNWTMRPIEVMKAGRMLLVDGGQGLMQPALIDDLIDGILAATQRGRLGESYILCGPQVVPFHEYYRHLGRMLSIESFRSVPSWLAFSLASLAELGAQVTRRPPVFTRQEVHFNLSRATFDSAKAQQELGYRPSTFLEEGMRRVQAWLEQEGHI